MWLDPNAVVVLAPAEFPRGGAIDSHLMAPEKPVISVMVDDVDAAYADAQQRGYEIVHPFGREG